MSFINKDQRTTSWQTKNKHNFIQNLSHLFFHFFTWTVLRCFFSMAEISYVDKYAIYPSLILFFLRTRSAFTFVLQNCSELAFVLGFNVKFGPTCLKIFCSHRLLVEFLILRKPAITKSSCFLENMRVPFDCKQRKPVINIKGWRHPTYLYLKRSSQKVTSGKSRA